MAVGVGEVHSVLRDHRYVTFLEVHYLPRMGQHRHHIGKLDIGRVLSPTDVQRQPDRAAINVPGSRSEITASA